MIKLNYNRTFKKALIWLFALGVFAGCQGKRDFTQLKNLEEYAETQFNPTLRNELSPNRNAVYSATMVLAWDKIKSLLHSPVNIPDSANELKLLHQSVANANVLRPEEFTASVQVDGYRIKAMAEFSKSLPFKNKLRRFNNKLVFNGTKVASFGLKGTDSYEQISTIEIVYYENDSHFILKLLPKDTAHVIYVYKTEKVYLTMEQQFISLKQLEAKGKEEKKNPENYRKYRYFEKDEVVIPQCNFNIETRYPALEGNTFTAGQQRYEIERAWQRNAFILDEKGAKVESESELDVAASEMLDEEIKPKKMWLNKPYALFLIRRQSDEPYFGLWMVNTELMVKEP